MGKQRYSWCLYVLINVLSSNVLDPFFPSWIVLLFNLQGLYYVQRSQLLYEHLWLIKFKCAICYEELAERRGFTRGGLVSQPQVTSQGEPSLKNFLFTLYIINSYLVVVKVSSNSVHPFQKLSGTNRKVQLLKIVFCCNYHI